jgi:hypothetical protein
MRPIILEVTFAIFSIFALIFILFSLSKFMNHCSNKKFNSCWDDYVSISNSLGLVTKDDCIHSDTLFTELKKKYHEDLIYSVIYYIHRSKDGWERLI